LRTAGDAGLGRSAERCTTAAVAGVDAADILAAGLTSTAVGSASSAANVTITSPTLTTCCSVTCTWATMPV
jgi:hypothetical protein